MDTWYDYRRVWSAHPWLLGYAVLVVAVLVVAVIGTVLGDVLAVLFIPALAGGYLHHLLVQRRLP